MTKETNYYLYKIFWFITLTFYPVFVKAGNCEKAFPSRLFFINQAKEQAIQDRKLHSEFIYPHEEQRLQGEWNSRTSFAPPVLDLFLPKDVSYIDHQLARPESPVSVKLANRDAIMARASYEYNDRVLATNVAFSPQVLFSNMQSKDGKKWLVGPDASAAVLFLHGMGMQTAGAHIARRTIRDFRKHFEDVHVLSLDLSWHAEGHREVLNSLSEEVMVLSAFVKKYIPPHVPLFIWGHSGGTILARQLMTMTDGPLRGGFFHPNLKGIMLFSPVVDAAPGRSVKEKQKAFFEGQKKGISEQLNNFVTDNPIEVQHFEGANLLGELYSMWMITQLNSIIPSHRGREYTPALLAIGIHDPLVFTGFPRSLFREYYDKLEKIDTHYLDRLPLLKTKTIEEVGHWLGEYMDSESGLPVQIALARQFMEKQGITFNEKNEQADSSVPSFLDVAGNYSNNLAFRQFVNQYRFLSAHLNPDLQLLMRTTNEKIKDQISKILKEHNIENTQQKKILGKIFSSLNFNELVEFLQSQSLPDQLLTKIVDYITSVGYFEIKQIGRGIYLPDKSKLLDRGFINSEHQEKAELLLTELSENISEHTPLVTELSILRKKENNLKKQYQNARKLVQAAMTTIGRALKKASEEPPPSITSDFILLGKELVVVRELADKMVKLFTELSVPFAFSPSVARMNDLVKEHETEVNHFRQSYRQYDLNREDLKRKLIRAISDGEMGKEYQQAVRDIYGQNLDGQGLLYLNLKEINQELAQLEADIYNKSALYNKSLIEYQGIFKQLFPLLQPVKRGDRDWVDLARNSYTFSDVSIHDILKPVDLDHKSETDQHSQVSQRINNEYEPFFRNVLDTWEQFNSNSLPDLLID